MSEGWYRYGDSNPGPVAEKRSRRRRQSPVASVSLGNSHGPSGRLGRRRPLSCAKFQDSFKWSTGATTAGLRALSGVFHRRLTSRAVESNHLFRRLAGETTRVPIANLAGHLDRSDARTLHTLSLPSA